MKDLRSFKRWKVYFLLSLVVSLTLVILACGDDATPTAAGIPGTTPTATATPRPNDTPTTAAQVPVQPRLRVAHPPGKEQFTIPYPNNQVTEKLMPNYSHLVGQDPKTGAEIPQLASSWSMGPDGKTWTWNLAEDIPFYKDGKPYKDYTFSAKDIILTWDLLIGEEGNHPTTLARDPAVWLARVGDPSNWEVVNDHKVVVHAPQVQLVLPYWQSYKWPSSILSRDHWDDVGGEDGYMVDPIGNGPWSYVDHSTNAFFLHERVENHWRKTPEFEELQFLLVGEEATRLAMLLAEEADLIPLLRSNREVIESAGFVTFKSTLPSVHAGIGFIHYREFAYCVDDQGNFDADGMPVPGGVPCGPSKGYDPDDPLRNPQVRRALALSVNNEEIINTFFDGKGFPAHNYFPAWQGWFKDEWAPYPGPEGKTGREGGWPYPYDVEAAKVLLTNAGYPDGFKTTLNCLLTHTVIPEWPDICEQVAVYFDAIGVDAEMEWVDSFGTFRAQTKTRERSNWMWSASPSPTPVCDASPFSMIWEVGNNYAEWPEASEFWEICTTAIDEAVRDKAHQDFGDAWLEQVFSIPMVWIFAEIAANPDTVQEYEVNMLNHGPVRHHEYTKPVYK